MENNFLLLCMIMAGSLLLSSCVKDDTYQEVTQLEINSIAPDLQLEINSIAPDLQLEVNSVGTEMPQIYEKGAKANVETRNVLCDILTTWVQGVGYQVGDRVLWDGYAFELLSDGGWLIIATCPQIAPTVSICDGILVWVQGQYYHTGDLVIWNNSVFQKASDGGWRNLGHC